MRLALVVGFLAIITAGCVKNDGANDFVIADGMYFGTVSFDGTNTGGCVPASVTLTFMAGELVGATGNTQFAYPMTCTADVDDGDVMISCPQSVGSETDCQAGGSSITGVTTLSVTATAAGMTGTIDANVTMTNPGCSTVAWCSGAGTVTFTKM
jgi:hypothetical protein